MDGENRQVMRPIGKACSGAPVSWAGIVTLSQAIMRNPMGEMLLFSDEGPTGSQSDLPKITRPVGHGAGFRRRPAGCRAQGPTTVLCASTVQHGKYKVAQVGWGVILTGKVSRSFLPPVPNPAWPQPLHPEQETRSSPL